MSWAGGVDGREVIDVFLPYVEVFDKYLYPPCMSYFVQYIFISCIHGCKVNLFVRIDVGKEWL